MAVSLEQLVVPLPGMELLGERKVPGRAGVCLDVLWVSVRNRMQLSYRQLMHGLEVQRKGWGWNIHMCIISIFKCCLKSWNEKTTHPQRE